MPMTPEERERVDRMDRQMVFLAEHQALMSVKLDKLTEDVQRLAEVTNGLVQLAVQHSRRFDEIHGSLVRLEKITEEHGRQIEKHGRQIEELGRQLSRTDDRLNVLIGVVERYFSGGGRN